MLVPSGEPFRYSYTVLQDRKRLDPAGWKESEGSLLEALKKARREFGYVHQNP